MRILSADFIKSSSLLSQCPPADKPEYAFIGRSNVGKSSLINALVQKKNLAMTSQTPGKTQLINHYLINENWYLVDLPGYGYAKVSKKLREGFGDMIQDYVQGRENLHCLFVLLDARLPPQAVDMEFMEYLGTRQIPFARIFTKVDKLNKAQQASFLGNYEQVMGLVWAELPPVFVSSAFTGEGIEEIKAYIKEINQQSILYKA
ncbi:MAG: ribosome biogenesis GTP-binding protein YihA/YsxC [Microscillaceae bacterium]